MRWMQRVGMICVLILAAGCSRQASPLAEGASSPPALSARTASEAAPAGPALEAAPSPTPDWLRQPGEVIDPENVMRLREAAVLPLGGEAYQLRWSQDSQVLAAFSSAYLLALRPVGLETLTTVVLQAPIQLLDYSPDAGWMATTSDPLTVDLRDPATGAVVRTLSSVGVVGAAFTPDGQSLVVANSDNFTAEVFNPADGSLRETLSGFETAAPIYGVQFDAPSDRLIWLARGTVQVMQLPGGQLGAQLNHEDSVSALALSPSGSVLAAAAAGTQDGLFTPLLQLWDPTSGEPLGRLALDQPAFGGMDFSADGRLLALSVGEVVMLYDVAAQQPLAALNGHVDGVRALRFSPDGRLLATLGMDQTLRLWKAAP